MDEKFRSRKFLLASFITLAATAFLGFDKLTGQEWSVLMGVVIGAYSWANARTSPITGPR